MFSVARPAIFVHQGVASSSAAASVVFRFPSLARQKATKHRNLSAACFFWGGVAAAPANEAAESTVAILAQGTHRAVATSQAFLLPVRCVIVRMRFFWRWRQMRKKRCSGAPGTRQRALHCILAQCPITASSAWFCVLCCQPSPMPKSLTARAAQFTPCSPCRLLA